MTSYAQAVDAYAETSRLYEARAEADVELVHRQPGVPMSYWLGRLETRGCTENWSRGVDGRASPV